MYSCSMYVGGFKRSKYDGEGTMYFSATHKEYPNQIIKRKYVNGNPVFSLTDKVNEGKENQ